MREKTRALTLAIEADVDQKCGGERGCSITAVVGSSPGSPISSPFRFGSANFYGEGPVTGHDHGEAKPGNWWLPSIKQYAGHEERLPIDGHGVMALIAPRAAAIADGWQDHEGDLTFADEANVVASSEVYSLLGADDKIRLIHRPGDHHGFDDVNTYFDFFDAAFNRLHTDAFPLGWANGGSGTGMAPFAQSFLTAAGFNLDVWNASVGSAVPPPPPSSAPLAERVEWLFGQSIAGFSPGSSYSENADGFTYTDDLLDHGMTQQLLERGMKRVPLAIGDYVTSNAYYPLPNSSACAAYAGEEYGGSSKYAGKFCCAKICGGDCGGSDCAAGTRKSSDCCGHSIAASGRTCGAITAAPCQLPVEKPRKMPAVIWLHPYSYSTGYTPAYGQAHVHEELAVAGFVVLTYDQLGFGLRLPQGGTSFYARYGGESSIFGHMVKDARSAVDFLYCHSDEGAKNSSCSTWGTPGLHAIPMIDLDHVYIMGYSLGGNVALHTAALDERVSGVAAFAAFTPYASDVSTHAPNHVKFISRVIPETLRVLSDR